MGLVLAVTLVTSIAVVGGRQWIGDALFHAAWWTSLAEQSPSPVDPFTKEFTSSPYVSPYAMVAAWLTRILGMDVGTALALLSAMNMIIWAASLTWLVYALTNHRGRTLAISAACGAAALLALWGVRPIRWSGFVSPDAAAFIWPYPSTLGMAVVFLLGGVWVRGVRGLGSATSIVVLTSLATLIHPFSIAVSVVVLLGVALGQSVENPWRLRYLITQSALVGCGVALAFLWPYSDLEALLNSSPEFNVMHSSLGERFVYGGVAFTLLGAVSLVLHRNSPWARSLAGIAVCGFVSLWLLLAVLGPNAWRLALAAIAPLQLAAGLHLGLMAARPDLRARVPDTLLGALVALGMILSLWFARGVTIPAWSTSSDPVVFGSEPCVKSLERAYPKASVATDRQSVSISLAYSNLAAATRWYPEPSDPRDDDRIRLRKLLADDAADEQEVADLIGELGVSVVVLARPIAVDVNARAIRPLGCDAYYVYLLDEDPDRESSSA